MLTDERMKAKINAIGKKCLEEFELDTDPVCVLQAVQTVRHGERDRLPGGVQGDRRGGEDSGRPACRCSVTPCSPSGMWTGSRMSFGTMERHFGRR